MEPPRLLLNLPLPTLVAPTLAPPIRVPLARLKQTRAMPILGSPTQPRPPPLSLIPSLATRAVRVPPAPTPR